MKLPNQRKKGTTLVELSVTMAIIAVVGTMVVSFCLLINTHVAKMAEANNIQSDFNLTETALNRFISRFDSEEYVFSSPNETVLNVTNKNTFESYALYFDEEKKSVRATFPGEESLLFPLETVFKMQFSVKSSASEKNMIICTVHYEKAASATGIKTEKNISLYKALRAAKEGGSS